MANIFTTNKKILLKKVITLIIIFCFNSYILAQQDIKPQTCSIKVANVLDDNFFNKLDSLRKEYINIKYKYYWIEILPKKKEIETSAISKISEQSPIIHVRFSGNSCMYDLGHLYVFHKGIRYFISESANNILVKYTGRRMQYLYTGKVEYFDLQGPLLGFYYNGKDITLDFFCDPLRGIGDNE